jgi:hypothetical protein
VTETIAWWVALDAGYGSGMAGPTAKIELPGPVADNVLAILGDELAWLSARFEVQRRGYFKLNIEPEALGVRITDHDRGGAQPFVVSVSGPGFGDEEIFDAEHAGGPDLLPLIGFRPSHDVGVLAMCRGKVNHDLTAALTARVMDFVGGVAVIELDREQVESVRALPGLCALVTGPGAEAYGSAQFVRAWAAHPEFRLLN